MSEPNPNYLSQRRTGPWATSEDQILITLVGQYEPINWVKISHRIGTRSAKQCRERYHQNLKPGLNHAPITHQEGLKIERLVRERGTRWAEIARELQGRSDNAVKNWYNGSQNRRKRQSARRRTEQILDAQRHVTPGNACHSSHFLVASHSGHASRHSHHFDEVPYPSGPYQTPWANNSAQEHRRYAYPSPSSSDSIYSELCASSTPSPSRRYSILHEHSELPRLRTMPTPNTNEPSLPGPGSLTPASPALSSPSQPYQPQEQHGPLKPLAVASHFPPNGQQMQSTPMFRRTSLPTAPSSPEKQQRRPLPRDPRMSLESLLDSRA